jgi:hypothetical protein
MADVPRLASRHPLAVRTEELPTTTDVLRRTAVTSRLRLGPFRWHITYQADVLTVADDHVVTVAYQRPRTTLVNDARFAAEPDGITIISVDISYESPRPLSGATCAPRPSRGHQADAGVRQLNVTNGVRRATVATWSRSKTVGNHVLRSRHIRRPVPDSTPTEPISTNPTAT